MIVKKDEDIREEYLEEEGITNVLKRVLIGPEDGSRNIIMRCFKILPQGNTPFHTHDFEHIVRVTRGKGVVVDESGEEMVISEGQNLYIEKNEKHQFKNPYHKTFEFLCIIPNPENRS
ncbi:MAG: cupin domain-containing protein [Candidatus Aminicenantales bacterium]